MNVNLTPVKEIGPFTRQAGEWLFPHGKHMNRTRQEDYIAFKATLLTIFMFFVFSFITIPVSVILTHSLTVGIAATGMYGLTLLGLHTWNRYLKQRGLRPRGTM